MSWKRHKKSQAGWNPAGDDGGLGDDDNDGGLGDDGDDGGSNDDGGGNDDGGSDQKRLESGAERIQPGGSRLSHRTCSDICSCFCHLQTNWYLRKKKEKKTTKHLQVLLQSKSLYLNHK